MGGGVICFDFIENSIQLWIENFATGCTEMNPSVKHFETFQNN